MPFFREYGFLLCTKISATCAAISFLPHVLSLGASAGARSGTDSAAVYSILVAILFNVPGVLLAIIGVLFQRDKIALWFFAANLIPLLILYRIVSVYFGWNR